MYIPSSISVFGPDSPKENVPLDGIRNPLGFYGVSKVFMENLGNYYKKFYNIDFRSVRYVGVISNFEFAYNGSTDYTTEVFFKARKENYYSCCLSPDRKLPMAFIEDIIDGTIDLIKAPKEKLSSGTYNMQSMSFTPEEYFNEVKKYYPELEIEYNPDMRDTISKNWPYGFDDSASRKDWGWKPKYDTIEKLCKRMYDDTKI